MLDQTAAQPRRNKCQHDEGEDSNVVLSLLHCLVDTKGEAGVMNVQHRQTHFYPPREGGNLFSQGWGGLGSGNLIQRCLLVDGVEAVNRHGTVWPWEISV